MFDVPIRRGREESMSGNVSEVGVEKEEVGVVSQLTPGEILKGKMNEIVEKALKSKTLDPQHLALFSIGRYEVENMLYRGEYVTRIEVSPQDLTAEEVHFGIGRTISIWFAIKEKEEKLKIEVTVPAGFWMLSSEEKEKFMALYNKYFRVYAERRMSELNSKLTDATIALRWILEELERKEPDFFVQLMSERIGERSVEEIVNELGIEVDC